MKPVALVGGLLIVAGVVIGNLPAPGRGTASSLPPTDIQ
jgi:hypothetical protein